MKDKLKKVAGAVINSIKDLKNRHKKILFRILLIILSLLILLAIYSLIYFTRLNIEKNTDISNAIHAIVINSNTEFESSFLTKFVLEEGTNVYILGEEIDKSGDTYYKVKYRDRVGKILARDVKYFIFDDKNEYALMSDVSQFNVGSQFNSAEEYELFLINNSINYVYIRAGGRGYGKAGNMYTDSNYQMYIDACEYLGVHYGFYYLDEALDEIEIDEEVEFIKDFMVNNATSMCKLPLTIDIEYQEGKGRADDVWEKRSNLVTDLTKKLKEVEIDSIVYTNYNRARQYLLELDTYFWLAYYRKDDIIPEEWYFTSDEFEASDNLKNKVIGWQFSERGAKKSGIGTAIDLSLVKNSFFVSILDKHK